MSKSKEDLKVLLLIIRDCPSIEREETDCFIRYTGLKESQFETLNVFHNPNFDTDTLETYDGVFVGGASDASVLQPEKYTFVEPCQRLMKRCIEEDIPVFASCFGFQLAVLALGEEIIEDGENFEMGTLPIKVSTEAKDDPLYRDAPSEFYAVSVHQQKATITPKGCIRLAYTENCLHSFRVKDKPFWAFQFHPEVDRQTLVDRLTFYKEKYTDGSEQLQAVIDNACEVPEAGLLCSKFVERVLLSW